MLEWRMKVLVSFLCCFLMATGNAVSAESDGQNDTTSEENEILAPPLKANFKKSNQNVDQVQKELSDVISTNQGLREDYMKRMEKIRAISEQAKIHQKILDNIKNQTSAKPSSVQQAVQQEKVRIIAEQARKNHELLKTLRSTQQQKSSQ